MQPLLAEHLQATFFRDYQALRDELMAVLGDTDLATSVGGESLTLGALCREIGEIEHVYAESLRTFRADFDYRNPDPRLETSVAALNAWYADLDRELDAALESLSEDDVLERRIERGDFDVDVFSPLARTHLDIYREALLIFYGKASVYLRAMGRPLPGHFPDWIG